MSKGAYSVYRHTMPDGKVYIGITSKKPTERWDSGNGYFQNKPFYDAIKAVGWKRIKHDILFSGISLREAEYIEHTAIHIYDSANPNNGYNRSPGNPNRWVRFDADHKENEKLNDSYYDSKIASLEALIKAYEESSKSRDIAFKSLRDSYDIIDKLFWVIYDQKMKAYNINDRLAKELKYARKSFIYRLFHKE